MSILLKGSLVLSVFLMLGFFAAYELMGVHSLKSLDDMGMLQKRSSHAHRNNHKTSKKHVTEPPAKDNVVTSATGLTCADAGYQLTDLCNVTESKSELLGALATFEDLGSVMFVDDVVDSLKASCPNNSWCLTMEEEKRLYTELGESYKVFCDMADCLVDIPDECLTDVSSAHHSLVEWKQNHIGICFLECIWR